MDLAVRFCTMSKPRPTRHPASHAHPSRDGPASRSDRDASARAARSSAVRGVGIVASVAVLVGAAYLIVAPRVLASYLRGAAERAGTELTFASVSTMYPGDLRIEELEVRLPAAGVTLFARSLAAWPRWRALLGNGPPIDVIRASDVELTWANGSVGRFDVQLRASDDSGEAGAGWMELEGPQATLRRLGSSYSSPSTRMGTRGWSSPSSRRQWARPPRSRSKRAISTTTAA